jgi:flagellar hook-length control protein FliK
MPAIVSGSGTDTTTAAALAAMGGAGPSASSAGTAAVAVHVSTPVGDAGFGRDISQQIVMLTKTGAQSAQLSLNPEHLGPVSVSIQMNGLEASLSISAGHEATRAALREALPQLHALFQQGGLQLGGAQVGDGSERNAGRQGQPGERGPSPLGAFSGGKPAVIGLGGAVPTPGAGPARLVDTFA